MVQRLQIKTILFFVSSNSYHIDLQQPCAIIFKYKWGKIKTDQNILMMVMNETKINRQREWNTQTYSQVMSFSTKLTPFLYLLYAYPETAETLEIPATVTTFTSREDISSGEFGSSVLLATQWNKKHEHQIIFLQLTKSSKSRMSWIILGLNHSLGQLPPLS